MKTQLEPFFPFGEVASFARKNSLAEKRLAPMTKVVDSTPTIRIFAGRIVPPGSDSGLRHVEALTSIRRQERIFR